MISMGKFSGVILCLFGLVSASADVLCQGAGGAGEGSGRVISVSKPVPGAIIVSVFQESK
jgi:hypothetical protein